MSIFGQKTQTTTESSDKYGYIRDDVASLDVIMLEASKDVNELRGGLYVADILMEEQVMEGANAEVLLEGVFGTMWAKIKEIFTKIWNKLKEWYGKIKRSLEIFFKSGAEFVKRFEKEIHGKSVKGFTYKTYEFTPDKGNARADAAIKVAEETVTEFTKSLEDAAEGKESEMPKSDDLDEDDAKEAILKELSVDSLSELEQEIHDAYIDDGSEKTEIEEFRSGLSKDAMVKMIKEKDKAISNIENAFKKTESQINRIIRSIDKASSKVKEDKANVGRLASFATEMLRFAVSIGSTGVKGKVAGIKLMAKESESCLKSFLRYKPAKESFGGDGEEEGTTSLLETAMRML